MGAAPYALRSSSGLLLVTRDPQNAPLRGWMDGSPIRCMLAHIQRVAMSTHVKNTKQGGDVWPAFKFGLCRRGCLE